MKHKANAIEETLNHLGDFKILKFYIKFFFFRTASLAVSSVCSVRYLAQKAINKCILVAFWLNIFGQLHVHEFLLKLDTTHTEIESAAQTETERDCDTCLAFTKNFLIPAAKHAASPFDISNTCIYMHTHIHILNTYICVYIYAHTFVYYNVLCSSARILCVKHMCERRRVQLAPSRVPLPSLNYLFYMHS